LPPLKGVILVGVLIGIIATGFWTALNMILAPSAEVATWLSGAFTFILGMLIGILFHQKTVLLIDFISVLTYTAISWTIYYYDIISTIEITNFITNFLLTIAYLTALAILGSITSIAATHLSIRHR